MANSFPRVLLWGVGATGACMGTLTVVKDLAAAHYQGDEKITGKTVIVTGANSGQGKELSQDLAKRGGRVIMGCYNMEQCEEVRQQIMEKTKNRQVVCKHLDLASLSSVRNFSKDVIENEKRVNILVNNAAVFALPKKTFTEDGFEKMFTVNMLGPFLLTNLLRDKMKNSSTRAQPGRVVNINCGAMFRGKMHFPDLNYLKRDYDNFEAYAQSKLALYLFTYELALRIKEEDCVNVYSIHPGYVNSELNRYVRKERNFIFRFWAKLMRQAVMKRPADGMQTALMCCVDEDLKSETGGHYRNCREDAAVIYPAMDEEAVRLWRISERWSQLDQMLDTDEKAS